MTTNEKIAVELDGRWKLYSLTLPVGCRPLGVVRRGVGDAGALAITPMGLYVQVNAGAVRNLPMRETEVAIAEAVRTKEASA